MVQPREPEAQIQAVGLEPDGFDQRRQCLLEVSESGEHLGEPGQGLRAAIGPLGNLGPFGPGFVRSV